MPHAQWLRHRGLCCLAALVSLVGSPAFAAEAGHGVQLDCAALDHTPEAKLMSQAPSGAKRVAKHVLQVTTAHGTVKFVDKPPYDDGLDGVHYHYCGYDAGTHTHLIGDDDNGKFTGKLVRDDDGKVIDGGKSVSIAPDGKTFLATAQEDGEDGEQWSVRTFGGAALWAGYAGILRSDNAQHVETVYAQFINPRWTADSLLIADASCGGDGKANAQVSLRAVASGLKWSPTPDCGKAPK